MINLEALRVFLSVTENGSFSEAGRVLHITQSAVSQTIRGLENHLNAPLFLRKGRYAELTEAGRVFLPLAQELLSSALRMQQTMLSMQQEVIGDMSVGCSTAAGKYVLPGLISRFRKIYPQVRVNVVIASREDLISKVLSGEIAMAVSSRQVEHLCMEQQEFFCDDVILIVPSGHRWEQYRRIYPDDILDEPLVMREETAGTREVLLQNLHMHDISIDMLNVSMTLGNTEAIEIAVEEGLGVAFVSRLAAERGIKLGRVVEVDVEGMSLKRQIYMFRSRSIPQTLSQAKFWEFISQSVANKK